MVTIRHSRSSSKNVSYLIGKITVASFYIASWDASRKNPWADLAPDAIDRESYRTAIIFSQQPARTRAAGRASRPFIWPL
jgi:hypothetical protein